MNDVPSPEAPPVTPRRRSTIVAVARGLFWNAQERRLRALWRLLGQPALLLGSLALTGQSDVLRRQAQNNQSLGPALLVEALELTHVPVRVPGDRHGCLRT